MRLWSLKTGKCTEKFFGLNKEINSCAFSYDSRQIFSSGFDSKLSLWNIKGNLKAQSEQNHQDSVSRIRFSPSAKNEFYVSVGWDGRLKVWTKFFKCLSSFKAHEDPIYALDINKTGGYLATGAKDGQVKIWKVSSLEKAIATYQSDSQVNDCAFNPKFQWIAAASDKSLRIWDIASEKEEPIVIEKADKKLNFKFTSIAWDENGENVFVGCSDGLIRVFNVGVKQQ